MVQLSIENRSDISLDLVKRLVELAVLPDGRLLVLIGDTLLRQDFQALSVPRAFVPYIKNI